MNKRSNEENALEILLVRLHDGQALITILVRGFRRNAHRARQLAHVRLAGYRVRATDAEVTGKITVWGVTTPVDCVTIRAKLLSVSVTAGIPSSAAQNGMSAQNSAGHPVEQIVHRIDARAALDGVTPDFGALCLRRRTAWSGEKASKFSVIWAISRRHGKLGQAAAALILR
ncbi:MAG: hypothetical protein U5N55_07375 [Cypionkella sp.]|nr:hypothetical protein [Cypionkella sp.]